MCGFADFDCGSNVGKCNGTLERKEDGIYGLFDDSLILERGEENMYSRIDPMLEKGISRLAI